MSGSSGWKFSVTIPSWTTTTLESDEPVVVRKRKRESGIDGMRLFDGRRSSKTRSLLFRLLPGTFFSRLSLVPIVISGASGIIETQNQGPETLPIQ
jgi:hypothetical protein